MTEEIINSDGSRNWEANILLDNIKRLEQENKELKEDLKSQQMINLKQQEIALDYWNALEEINKIAEPRFVNGLNEEADLCNLAMDRIQNKINEVLNDI